MRRISIRAEFQDAARVLGSGLNAAAVPQSVALGVCMTPVQPRKNNDGASVERLNRRVGARLRCAW